MCSRLHFPHVGRNSNAHFLAEVGAQQIFFEWMNGHGPCKWDLRKEGRKSPEAFKIKVLLNLLHTSSCLAFNLKIIRAKIEHLLRCQVFDMLIVLKSKATIWGSDYYLVLQSNKQKPREVKKHVQIHIAAKWDFVWFEKLLLPLPCFSAWITLWQSAYIINLL